MPYYGIVKNYGSPGGFYTLHAVSEIAPKFCGQYGSTHKIQSFVGVFIYELGGLGIIILILMGVTLKKKITERREIFILYIAHTKCTIRYGLGTTIIWAK